MLRRHSRVEGRMIATLAELTVIWIGSATDAQGGAA
jgi:hypothetical protein